MSLFVCGKFTLHGGDQSDWLIDCTALTLDDLDTLASMVSTRLCAFRSVYGIPLGGVLFAAALGRYKRTYGTTLIVDDVLTTGTSMEAAREELRMEHRPAIGVVIFSRGPCPEWVTPIFTAAWS